MKRLLALFFCFVPLEAAAQEPDPDEIVRRFGEKESEFQNLWEQYTYTQSILFQVLNASGRATEHREMVIEVYFSRDGQRNTRILQDRGALRSVRVTDEDIQDALNLQPFALTSEEIPNYEIKYRGRERVDELGTYVFDVKPQRIRKGKRYFRGRIWVDDLDYQIVMTKGKAVPETRENKFPEFETIREQVDGKYWFPTWTEADDILYFGGSSRRRGVHIRELITYQNYKKFEVDTSISYGPIEQDPESEEKGNGPDTEEQ